MKQNQLLLSRRRTLKQLSIGSALLLFRKQLSATGHSISYAIWKDITNYARWCPTVHNMQPHKLKIVSETEAVLYYDPIRLLPAEDAESRFATVALGIFTENLSIAAAHHKLKIETKILDTVSISATQISPFAHLSLVALRDTEPIDRELIKKRKTSRLHYDDRLADNNVLDHIKNEASNFNCRFYNSSDKKIVDFLVRLNQKTLFEDISVDSTRHELDHLFRYTREDAETKKDGLWARCMGVSGVLLKQVFHHPGMWKEGFLATLLSIYYKSFFKGTRTIGWFTGDFNNTADWFNCGRMLARNWLNITSANMYMHPFGSLITNQVAYKKISQRLSVTGDDKPIFLVFRMGHSADPVRSYRLDLNDLFI